MARTARQAQRRVLSQQLLQFLYLAAALRKRMDAISVSIEAPDGEHAGFYHGNDLCLYDADPFEMQRKIDAPPKRSTASVWCISTDAASSLSPSEFDYSSDLITGRST